MSARVTVTKAVERRSELDHLRAPTRATETVTNRS